MNLSILKPADGRYPAGIETAFADRPALAALGNLDLLQTQPLAFFCSVKCPGEVILQTYDTIRALRDAGVPMIGGFHSPMEKECLALLLRGRQPVIICPARGIEGMRIPAVWKKPLSERRLLVLSPFKVNARRITAANSEVRNRLVATLAHQILVAHAAPGSKTATLLRELLTSGKPFWTLPGNENEHLVRQGVQVMERERITCLAAAWGTPQQPLMPAAGRSLREKTPSEESTPS